MFVNANLKSGSTVLNAVSTTESSQKPTFTWVEPQAKASIA